MNTLQQYQLLTEHPEYKEDLGCELPTLHQGTLIIDHQRCTQAQLAERLAEWQQAQGWYQLSDCTALGMPEDTRFLLEGQWVMGERSLHVQLQGPEHYSLTELASGEASPQSTQCYRDQLIWLRNDLRGDYNALRYRLWWQQQENGAWRAQMQQFIGLARLEEK